MVEAQEEPERGEPERGGDTNRRENARKRQDDHEMAEEHRPPSSSEMFPPPPPTPSNIPVMPTDGLPNIVPVPGAPADLHSSIRLLENPPLITGPVDSPDNLAKMYEELARNAERQQELKVVRKTTKERINRKMRQMVNNLSSSIDLYNKSNVSTTFQRLNPCYLMLETLL